MMSSNITIPTPLDILNEFSKRGLPKHFCIAPFANMISKPDGKVGICREKGLRLTIDNLYEPHEFAISSLPEAEQLAICEDYLKKLNWARLQGL